MCHDTVSQRLRTLFSQKLDAVIVIDSQELKGNQTLLSTYSVKLSEIIIQTQDTVFIPIKGHDYEDVQNVLQLIHEGQVSIDESKAEKFYHCLEKLQIVGFIEEGLEMKNIQTNPPSPPRPKVILLPKGDGKVLCIPCQKEFSSTSNANRHVRTSHEVDPSGTKFPCIACPRSFGNKPHLDDHLRKEHQITQKMLRKVNETKKTVGIKQEKNLSKVTKKPKVRVPKTKKMKEEVYTTEQIEANNESFDQPPDPLST